MVTRVVGTFVVLLSSGALAAAPATRPADVVDLPSIRVDRAAREVRVACQALGVDAPLEFYCVTAGGPEHESVLRTAAKPSQIHAGLLLLGLEPGAPMTYVAARDAWTPPRGEPVRVSVEWADAAGRLTRVPAERLLRPTVDAGLDEAQAAPPMGWVFAGSTQRDDGAYLADLTGYVVTLANFEHALIDVPRLVSSANESLQWRYAPDAGPARGQAVTMILEPAGGPADDPAGDRTTRPSATRPATMPAADAEIAQAADAELDALRDRWRAALAPHAPALRDAARAHHALTQPLRERQRALLAEADRLQATIDALDRAYAEATEPSPPSP